ncbi:MAG: SDR family NAD(P)-dependent oxidoreductase [Anaerolineales bacterium]|jgi:benzil reductase ((S)-benzoin forming)
MENGFFLITGTSRGIGAALAQRILEEGHTVLGVSRGQSNTLKSPKYHHLSFDLSDKSRITQIMAKANEIVDAQTFDFVCLVNNASAAEPIGPIEKCPPEEIESHVSIGLIAPMLLTSMFIRRFINKKIRKKVVFISSGAAFTPLAGESIYCSSKAGLNMLAQCVGLEQKEKEYGFEVQSIGPGMVDTSMQLAARSKSSDEFAMADFFKQAYEEGKLKEPDKVAEKIYTILENTYEQGKYVSVNETQAQ